MVTSSNETVIQITDKSRYKESRMNEINFPISLAWAEGGIDVGDYDRLTVIEKCCE